MKQKTQELEKFKFVLDYKIKELKREIKPREVNIQNLNEQTTKMKQEVKHFTRVNQNLRLIVEDLQMRQKGLEKESHELQESLGSQAELKRRFKEDTQQVLSMHLSEYKKLKAGVIRLYKQYSLSKDEDADTKKMGESQGETGKGVESEFIKVQTDRRKHLEQNLQQVRAMLLKNWKFHKSQYSKIMKENVTLL